MKHKTLTILIFLSILYTQNIDFSKNFAFDSNHTTFKIFSDSLYYIISNMTDVNHIKKNGIIAITNNKGELQDLVTLGNNNYILSGTKTKNGDFLFIGYNKSNNDEWNKIYVVKTNKNLEVIWENSYGVLNSDSKGYSIIELNEKEYWILAYTKTSKNGTLILKIDEERYEALRKEADELDSVEELVEWCGASIDEIAKKNKDTSGWNAMSILFMALVAMNNNKIGKNEKHLIMAVAEELNVNVESLKIISA